MTLMLNTGFDNVLNSRVTKQPALVVSPQTGPEPAPVAVEYPRIREEMRVKRLSREGGKQLHIQEVIVSSQPAVPDGEVR